MGIRGDGARHERAALCATLTASGPNAPTLCEGWTARDLLHHLILREAGMTVSGPRARRELTAALRDDPWEALIDRFRAGPPRGSPFRIPGADGAANLEEFFVHHEDVRRGAPGWTRRDLPRPMQDALWRWLRTPFGRLLVRRSDVGVHVQRPEGDHVTLRARRPGVVVRGRPSEILLYVFGRRDAADVDVSGTDEALARLSTVRWGM